MKRFSPTIIGTFILGAVVLATIGILSFGAQSWWRESANLALYFDGSVHGLERGSAVRLMGVRVGQVSAINVRYVSGMRTAVQVICEIDRSPTLTEVPENDMRRRETLERMVADGLQARLDLIGITGMLYVEMDFFGAPPEQTLKRDHPEYVVVPTVQSILTGMTDNLAEIAKQLGDIDFAALGESAVQLMDNTNKILEEARLDELFVQLHNVVQGVNQLVESAELEKTMVSAGQTFEDLSRLSRLLESKVDPLAENFAATSDEVRQTLGEASQTLVAIQELVGPRLGIGFQMDRTLNTIEEAARSVERLAEFLERNPQAILRGRGGER